MDSIATSRGRPAATLRRIASLVGLLAMACVPGVALAAEGGYHVETGLGGRTLLGFGSLAREIDRPAGPDFDLHLVRNKGGLGLRLEGGAHALKGATVDLPAFGLFDTEPSLYPLGLEQVVDWVALGPAWSRPLRHGRLESYVLIGGAWTTTTVVDEEYGSGYFYWSPQWVYTVPRDTEWPQTFMVVAGASWCVGRVRVWRLGFGLEAGAEMQAAGKVRALADPPLELVDGGYRIRTRLVPMSAAALRVGVNFLGWMAKRD
jgi:hypothetical protein